MKRLFFIYSLFLFLFALFSYLFIDPNFIYLKAYYSGFFLTQRPSTTIAFIFFLILFYLFYLFFLHYIRQKKLHTKKLALLVGITLGILLFSYPAMLSFDIFNYIATAKVTFFYHENPYIIMPIEFTKDPLLLFMHAPNKTALYAPFWILLTSIPFLFGFNNFMLILFNFKILAIIFYLLTTLLLYTMTRDIEKTAFFALNPLVVIETVISGHNDIVMMFLLLLCIYYFFNSSLKKSTLFYTLSVGIKYATLILLPLFAIAHKRKLTHYTFFIYITLLMSIIFLLSSLREEIYPWYGIWILLPGSFLIENASIKVFLISVSFGLLLRYIPFMLLGTYFGPTPLLKVILMLTPPVVILLGTSIKKVIKYL